MDATADPGGPKPTLPRLQGLSLATLRYSVRR